MERGLINQAIQKICVQEGKEISEAHQYLLMKYRIEVDLLVLKKRYEKMLNEEKAVA
ncbi:hypothetical protein [Algoriphagus pacificus]|uniref:Uncharacterized protein n=1 Tax=Algoriphagus pacificus TaxID=2811234 RepID=A0ABS3CDK3_9BACT|nr:hypothetical protein [Algoriphagus pacificus]MBN7814875.1 hypothetical protein [Algoriphagus pacificus]